MKIYSFLLIPLLIEIFLYSYYLVYMKLFPKKKKQASRIRMPKGEKKKSAPVLRRKKRIDVSSIFKKKKHKYSYERRSEKKYIKYIVLPLAFILFSGLIFLAVKYVILLRQSAFGTKEGIISQVIGLEEIPTYPDSEFIFQDRMEDSVVKEFISQGNSAYRLPVGAKIEDVESYYMEEMQNLGWEFVQSVPLGSPDKKYGQYWIKEDLGLRIYSKFKDLWYESISIDDAKSALANLVKEEIEREMLMASSEKQDLLPDYPWKIQVPKEYIIKYSPTDMKDLRAVSFQKIGTIDSVEIFPIGYWKAKELDFMLNDYCKLKSTDEIKYGVMNSIPISFRDTLGLKSTLQKNEETITAYTIPNTYNSVVYVISANSENSPLLEYLIENIKPLDAKE